jgi:hypothetical protein
VATAEQPSSDRAASNIGVAEGSGLPEEPAAAAADRAVASARAQGDVTVTSQSEQPVGTTGQAESTTAQAELPATASPFALGTLIGALSMLGAAGIRLFRS